MPNNQLCESPVNQTNLSKKPSKRRLRWIIFILVIIVLLLVIFLRGKKQTQEAAQTQTAKNITTLRIGDESTRYALLEKTLKVTSRDEAKIYAQYSGRIQQVNFKAGDKVAAGQILASFDQSSRENTTVTDLDLARSSVQYAEDNLDSVQDSSQKDIKIAKNNVEIAKIALEKIKSDQDSTSQDIKTAEETLEQAKRQRDKTEIQAEQQEKTAKNSLDSARANLEKAAAVHGRTIITAPISGVISQKQVSANEYVNSGQLIAVVSNNRDLNSTLYLTMEEVQGLKPGDDVQINCANNDSQNLTREIAKIDSISSVPNSSNSRYALAIDFPQGSTCVLANNFVKANFKITGQIGSNLVYLPLEAVKIGQNRNIVFVIQDNAAKTREVKTGNVFGQYIEITHGLNQGEVVAIGGSRNLQDGDEVFISSDLN